MTLELWKHNGWLREYKTSREEVASFLGLVDRDLADSVMSNVAEGFERGGNREFQQFLSVAKGSAGEVKSQLYVALDAGHIDQKDFNHIYQLADETGRLIGGFLRYLSKSEHRGSKFRTRNP